MNLLTAPQIWADYDADKYDLDAKIVNCTEKSKIYTFTALKKDDGNVEVQIEVNYSSYDSEKILLVIGQYNIPAQREVIDNLVKCGYVVCVPDYSGITKNTYTKFPDSLEYGYYEKSGEHIKKVCPSALETCQYLYSVIIKRAITFINKVLGKKEIVLIGFGSGVEIAMQVAGNENRLIGLVCINGASYLEYVKYNKHGDVMEIPMSDELMSWLTGVSSIAYAKHIKIPILFALGSNGQNSDIDRLSNIFNLIPANDIKLVISPRYIDNIDLNAYKTITAWLASRFVYGSLPKIPSVNVSINKEGAVYADVKIDNIIKADKVTVYYSYGDYNHATRYWEEEIGESVAPDDFIAKLEITEPDAPLFVFASVQYKNGITLSSIPNYQALSSYKVKTSRDKLSPIIFQHSSDECAFIEVSENAVLLESSIKETTIPVGLKGIKCENGAMVSFAIGAKKNIPHTKFLQFDTYSDEKEYEFSVTIITGGETPDEYTALKEVEAGETFYSQKFLSNDFKNTDFMPLEDWSRAKGLRINTPNIVVGKIMFV